LLEVSVYGAPDFDHKDVRVSNSGEIVLPLIGAQHVAKLTAAQAQSLIADKLTKGDFFNKPQVSIFVKEYATQGVSVLGEVQKPGVYPLLGPRRLFDAISQAGGLSPKAGKVVTVTHCDDPKHPERVMLAGNLENTVEGNVAVMPGDTIVVSKAGIVYVVGDVKLPGGFVMENDSMTVLQAVALAQGAMPTAALDKSKLIRTVNSEKQEVPVELKQILSSKKDDLKLQANDILFIPNSASKTAMRRGLEMAVQVATGVAIYRP
jgi:polysaccharide export outer membrane protein